MTDAKTRTTRRAAAAGDPDAARRLLVEQLRAGTLRPGLRVEPEGGRVIRLADLGYTDTPGPGGQGRGGGLDPRAVLRLRAYVGDEAAREMVPVSECSIRAGRWDSWDDHDRHIPLDTWLKRLAIQADPMPDVVGERADRYVMDCPGGAECRHPQSCPVRCVPGSSWRYPYTRWLIAAVATRVAEGVLPVWEAREGFEWTGPDRAPRRAVDAARAWVLCPCPEHEEAWRAFGGGHGFAPGYADTPFQRKQRLIQAARLTTEDQVRAWVREAAREAVLGG